MNIDDFEQVMVILFRQCLPERKSNAKNKNSPQRHEAVAEESRQVA